MEVSNAFKSIILRKAQKGLRYNRRKRCLEYEISLTHRENEDLIDLGMHQFGFTNKVQLGRLIESVAWGNDNVMSQETPSCLSIADLLAGDVFEINYEADSHLILLVVKRGLMLCIDDNNGDLHYGDEIHLLNLVIERGKPAYMRIIRNGEPYPDENRCYCIDMVNEIVVHRNETNIMDVSQVQAKTEHTEGIKVIYAVEANSSGRGFSMGNFTNSIANALFVIDLSDMSFKLNNQFVLRDDNKGNVLYELKRMCECAEEIDNLLRVRNEVSGCLKYRKNGDVAFFEIVQPLKVKVI